jgi:pimeloyl-ACP methyl ester carboxylesterase
MSGPLAQPAVSRLHDGGPAAPSAVLVHGSLADSASFRPLLRHLTGWTLVSYDRRGWGQSRELGHPEVTLDTHVADLCAILGTMSAPLVAGHSYGGLVALSAAGQHPELFSAILAYEPPVRWLPWWPVDDPWEQLVRQAVADGGSVQAARVMLEAVLGRAGRALGQRGGDEAGLAADGAALATEMTEPSLDQPRFDPAEVHVPVLLAAGSDSLGHHREITRRLACLLPNARFTVLDGAQHAAHVTHPARFANLVRHARPGGQS